MGLCLLAFFIFPDEIDENFTGFFVGINLWFNGQQLLQDENSFPGPSWRHTFVTSTKQKPKAMKATNNITRNILKSLILIVSMFFIQISTVSAEGFNSPSSATLTLNTMITSLAPNVPSISDFNDAELNATDFIELAPVAPAEADFSETPETSTTIADLAPVSPAEADFND